MKKLSKIKLVELPKNSLLNDDEQSSLLGGEIGLMWNCISFHQCDFFRNDSCGTWDSGVCEGAGDKCTNFTD